MLVGELSQADLDHLSDLLGRTAFRPHRKHHARAEIHRDTAIDAQLGRRGDVCVVRADDHHRVALVGHHVVPVDDLGDRTILILVQLLIRDTHALFIRQTGGGLWQQQIEDVVTVLAEPRDRPEHTDFRDSGSQPV